MKLTKTIVEGAQPQPRKYRLNDSLVPGLCLLVLPSGGKTYYLRHRQLDGQQRELKLGTPVELTPDDARRLAREALAQVREGKKPTEERRALRRGATLADLYDDYMEHHGKAKRSGLNDDGYWRNHILKHFGPATKVVSLSQREVATWHKNHPRKVTANRAMEMLKLAMSMAEQWGWRPKGSNPCEGIPAHPEKRRKRYLKPDERDRLLSTLDAWERDAGVGSYGWRFVQMIRLLLLTGARLGNIMRAKWEWVDWDRSLICVPPENHKTGDRTGDNLEIHLSPEALRILQDLKRAQNIPNPHIIAGEIDGKPMGGYRDRWVELLQQAAITKFRLHDLRHSFASYVLQNGYTLADVGGLLGHKSTQTTAIYGHLVDERAKQAVATLGGQLIPGKVEIEHDTDTITITLSRHEAIALRQVLSDATRGPHWMGATLGSSSKLRWELERLLNV